MLAFRQQTHKGSTAVNKNFPNSQVTLNLSAPSGGAGCSPVLTTLSPSRAAAASLDPGCCLEKTCEQKCPQVSHLKAPSSHFSHFHRDLLPHVNKSMACLGIGSLLQSHLTCWTSTYYGCKLFHEASSPWVQVPSLPLDCGCKIHQINDLLKPVHR